MGGEIYGRIRAGDWDGEAFRRALMDGEMPEYHGSEVLPSIFEFEPGECPYHLESLVDHVCGTIEHAISLADRFRVVGRSRVHLVAAATWHDVGKMITRIRKDRWVCPACGRAHPADGACRTAGCPGELELRSVVGYHGHARVGASAWVWGNISAREGVDPGDSSRIAMMIRWHSDVHDRIIGRGRRTEDAMSVLLSWADEVAKLSPPFVGISDERPLWKFERSYARAVGSEGDRGDANHATAAEGRSGDRAR